MINPPRCPINITCTTKKLIKEQSLTFDEDGKPTETYDGIIRRGMEALSNKNKIDVSRL